MQNIRYQQHNMMFLYMKSMRHSHHSVAQQWLWCAN